MSRSTPRVLAIIPGLFPSTIIGVAKPLFRLHLHGRITLDLKLPFLVNARSVEQADVVVTCRSLSPHFASTLEWVKSAGVPLIHELDDNLIDVPEHIPGLEYVRRPEVRRLLIGCLRAARVVRVYSPALRERLAEFNDRVELVAGPLDWALIPEVLPRKDPSKVRLVYATSRGQDAIGRLVVRPLRRALDAFSNVELTIWGPRLDGLSDHSRVRHLPHVADYDTFLSRFVAEAFDIGLAPLPDDPFHRCKSNNKFREFAASGIAGIYSDMPVYNTWVTHGETGWLVSDGDDAWFAALERAVADAETRARIAATSRQFAREHFNERVTDREWMAVIGSVAGGAKQPAIVSSPGPADATSTPGIASTVQQRGLDAARMAWRDGLGPTARRAMWVVSSRMALAAWKMRQRRAQRRRARPMTLEQEEP